MVQSFKINKDAADAYAKYVPDFEYGLIAVGNLTGEAVAPALGGELCVPQSQLPHDFFDIKINGITDEHADKKIVFCAYINANGTVYYLDNNVTCEALTGFSYNEIVNILG